MNDTVARKINDRSSPPSESYQAGLPGKKTSPADQGFPSITRVSVGAAARGSFGTAICPNRAVSRSSAGSPQTSAFPPHAVSFQ